MVWPFTSNKNGSDSNSSDVLRNLDPALRDLLEKETPRQSQTAPPPPLPPTPPSPSSPAEAPSAVSDNPNGEIDLSRNRSLFKDGRYNHIWATYRPKHEVDAEGKSDSEKLMDVLGAYKERRASIGRASIENCADLQYTLNDCFRSPGLTQRMNMCRHETRALDRCYKMNTSFLKALGYLSVRDRPPEIDEQIQMHADKLFHQMLDHEKAVEEAKAEGKPIPSAAEALRAASPSEQAAGTSTGVAAGIGGSGYSSFTPDLSELDRLSERGQKKLEARLKGLKPAEQELEKMAYARELRAALETSDLLDKRRAEAKEEREQRKTQGTTTLGDRFSSLFGW